MRKMMFFIVLFDRNDGFKITKKRNDEKKKHTHTHRELKKSM